MHPVHGVEAYLRCDAGADSAGEPSFVYSCWDGYLAVGAVRPRRLIRVHLKDGKTLSGYQRRGQWGGHLILDLAKVHEDAMNTHSLDGVVEIPRENVSFLQKLSAVEQL